ncbi:efflux RND transporter periplasmic adaptor subunit [Reichenbachiella carrageenanivorans]|uniref:Efflux RND transporter periplasmic adaptor subunit n=1 Tax=Reichenbachiella carrageenanivorans TaxID=2979869 RepID=A0ABY6CY69_9BACT|nr:efflux RND transporter periplasmic adaptor subunit [Reichenbachiella carrageenanivorans]UXX78315.1 efflux RND transporter periplasmic adaptor subunit [Reichenbachiella carrageenanivorans]
MKKIVENKFALLAFAVLLGGVIGWLVKPTNQSRGEEAHVHEEGTGQTWTCAMHPQIRQTEPGNCPICGMTLTPLSSDTNTEDPVELKMTPTAMQLADVQTEMVTLKIPTKIIRINGKVKADERYVFTQTSHISGRIEQLLLNYTGEYVYKGKVIAYLYSPELVTAQKELFEAYKIRDNQPVLYNASREKLKKWKLTDQQIDGILSSGQPMESFPILSDLTGVVTTKKVNLGDHIKQGAPLFEVANLNKVWLLFDIYERDMAWVKKGDKVNYTFQALPGESFVGNVTFIDPVIDAKSRVARARITVDNRDGRLKPEMFVRGTIEAQLTGGEASIVIPKSAVMWTGKRSIVYVKTNATNGTHFMLRKVTLGPSLGESFVITAGLEAGEEIATHGTFSIDAAAQLAGKPSMMSVVHTPRAAILSVSAKQALAPVYHAYFEMKNALVDDNWEAAKQAGIQLKSSVEGVDMSLFLGSSHGAWLAYRSAFLKSLAHIHHQANEEGVRGVFLQVSSPMVDMTVVFGPLEERIYVQHCPMAERNKGADWLSLEKEIKNPYFGSSMIRCGENRIILK